MIKASGNCCKCSGVNYFLDFISVLYVVTRNNEVIAFRISEFAISSSSIVPSIKYLFILLHFFLLELLKINISLTFTSNVYLFILQSITFLYYFIKIRFFRYTMPTLRGESSCILVLLCSLSKASWLLYYFRLLASKLFI